MARAPYIWKGHKELEVGKDEWNFDEQLTVTVPFTGPFAKCLSSRPKKGQQIAGFSQLGLTVKSSKVTRLEGDAGELTVTLTASLPPSEWQFEEAESETIKTTLSLTFRSIEKDIHTLRQCGTLSEAAVAAGVTWDDWPKILANPEYYVENAEADSWDHNEYIELRQAGIESKLVFYPVVTRVIEFPLGTAVEGVGSFLGKRVDPPETYGLTGWQWLCSGDGLEESGDRLVRTTEWTGAEKVNALLYPEP